MNWYDKSFLVGRTSEEPPQRRSGDDRGKSEQSNTHDPFWSGEATAVALTAVEYTLRCLLTWSTVMFYQQIAVCIVVQPISILCLVSEDHAPHLAIFSGETRFKGWVLDPHGKAAGRKPTPHLTCTAVMKIHVLCSPILVPGAAWKLCTTAVVLTCSIWRGSAPTTLNKWCLS